MPDTFTDTFYVLDPYNPPIPGSLLFGVEMQVTDTDDDGDVDRYNNDTIDGVDILAVYVGDTVTVIGLSGPLITYVGATFYLADGRQVFTPTDGQDLETGALVSAAGYSVEGSVQVEDFSPPCFVPGTRIQTQRGNVDVETIVTGDFVLTADKGPQEVLAAKRAHISAADLTTNPRRTPVRIAQGALGNGLPVRDLTVSPQHRMVLSGALVQRMFGAPEIMVPACKLVGLPGIARQECPNGVTYIHLLCARHQVIFAENAPTESLFLGEQVEECLSPQDIAVLRARLADQWPDRMEPARLFVRGAKLRKFLKRAEKNSKALVEAVTTPERELEFAD